MPTCRLFFLLLIFMSSCSSFDHVVESDYSYEGNFNKYRSFAFATNGNFMGTDDDKVLMKRYLDGILQSWGYQPKERKPDLVIFYNFYYDDLVFHGYSQPEFKTWVRGNYSKADRMFDKDSLDHFSNQSILSYNESYDEKKYQLREGSILISLYDRRRKITAWQGYASGVFGVNQKRNERILRSAIIQVMDEFRVLAFQSS